MSTLITTHGISKEFPGVKALDNVDFELRSGEVHALVGENGAGKSTLIKILMGVYQRDSGSYEIKGKSISTFSPLAAKSEGLAAVYQDISLAPNLSVGENFFLGNVPKKGFGALDWRRVYRECGEVLEGLGLDIDPRILLKDLSVANQEMVAIAKPVFENADILIFDEPTALLANEEVEILFSIIRKLKAEGKGVIYISHRMEEIFTICDRVTVLKDGALVDTLETHSTDADELMRLMVGRSMENMYVTNHPEPGQSALRVDNLCHAPAFRDISFDVRRGEIFGLFGLVGSGRTEILRGIFGADQTNSGDIYLHGEAVKFKHPKDAISAGIGFMSEDRKGESIAMPLSVRTNVNLANYPFISRLGIIDIAAEKAATKECINVLRVKTPSDTVAIRNLSGGNQQKVVLGKSLTTKASVLICDEPTIGVDVGAKSEIYKIFEQLTADGATVLLVSSYLPEIMGLSDRILVLHNGEQMGIVSRQDFDEEKLIRLASGMTA